MRIRTLVAAGLIWGAGAWINAAQAEDYRDEPSVIAVGTAIVCGASLPDLAKAMVRADIAQQGAGHFKAQTVRYVAWIRGLDLVEVCAIAYELGVIE